MAAGLGDGRASPAPASWEELALVHDGGVPRARAHRGAVAARAARPRPAVVARARRARPALVAGHGRGGARRAARRLGHEPRRRHAPRRAGVRPRLLPVQRRRARRRASCAPRARCERVLIVDCDVHQGDGTAELCAGDADAFALSIHGAANYPFHRATSDRDVDLPTGTGDDEYLDALEAALHESFPRRPPRPRGLPRRRRPVGGRRPRPPRAHQARPARARRARHSASPTPTACRAA